MLKLIKYTIVFYFLSISISFINAQESLIAVEKEYKLKSTQDLDYYEITAKYAQLLLVNHKKNESFKILEKNYKNAEKLNDFGNYSYLKSIEAIQFAVIGELDKSKSSYKEALKNIDKTSNYNIKGYVSYAGGWLAIREKKIVEAVAYFLDAIKHYDNVYDNKNTYRRKSITYNELARIYADLGDFQMHEKYTNKTLEFALLQDNQDAIFDAYMAVGYMYEEKLKENPTDIKVRDLVELNYTKAINIYKNNQMLYPSDLSFATINLASLYINYFPSSYKEKAKQHLLVAKEIAIVNDEPNHHASILLLLADISLKENNKTDAKEKLLGAITILEKSQNKDPKVELSIYERLIQIETELLNHKNALDFQKIYLEKFKSLYDSEKLEITKRLEADFEKKLQLKEFEKLQLVTDKKEQQIKLLNIQNLKREIQLNNLNLIRENQEKKIKLSELIAQKKQHELKLIKIETQNKNNDLKNYQEKLTYKEELNRYYILIIVAIALILLLLLFLLRQRTKRLIEREKTYSLAIEKEKQNTKISGLTSLLDGQEKERERLAKDLHDGLGGLLSAIKLQVSDLLHKAKFSEKTELIKISEHIDFAINKMRRISHNLMPDILIKYGLETALKEFANRMKNENLEIHVSFLSYSKKIEKNKELFVYRIIQELVNNAIKHANAKNIIIQLVEEEKMYRITVEDDGDGFVIGKLEFQNSAGLINIQSRIQFLKGNFEIHSQKNLGTSFEFNFPKN